MPTPHISAAEGDFAPDILLPGDPRRATRIAEAFLDDARLVTEVRGIGTWTAHMMLMFSLGRADVLPVGDFGVRKGARVLYALDAMPKPSELEALAEPWRP